MKLNFSGIWIVAIMFYGLALYTFIAKKPMNFWAGHKISSKKIKNIKAYNICLAIMSVSYTHLPILCKQAIGWTCHNASYWYQSS